MEFLRERFEGFQIGGIHVGAPFDFHGGLRVAQDEVHFQSRPGSPEPEGEIQAAVGPVGDELHQQEMLERFSEDFAAGFLHAAVRDDPGDADVEEIEFAGLPNDLAMLLFPKGRDQRPQQGSTRIW